MKKVVNSQTGKILELEDAPIIERPIEEIEAEILQNKINEAKSYLLSTDYKMTVDYIATLTKDEQDNLIKLRAEARQFTAEIMSNGNYPK